VRQTKLASSLVNVSASKNTHYYGNICTTNRASSSITDTRIAHASQNRACPHGTSTKPAHGATRHTSQQSSEVVAVPAVADSDDPEVVAAGTGACLSSSSSSLLHESTASWKTSTKQVCVVGSLLYWRFLKKCSVRLGACLSRLFDQEMGVKIYFKTCFKNKLNSQNNFSWRRMFALCGWYFNSLSF